MWKGRVFIFTSILTYLWFFQSWVYSGVAHIQFRVYSGVEYSHVYSTQLSRIYEWILNTLIAWILTHSTQLNWMHQLYSTQLNWVELNAWVWVYPHIRPKTDCERKIRLFALGHQKTVAWSLQGPRKCLRIFLTYFCGHRLTLDGFWCSKSKGNLIGRPYLRIGGLSNFLGCLVRFDRFESGGIRSIGWTHLLRPGLALAVLVTLLFSGVPWKVWFLRHL